MPNYQYHALDDGGRLHRGTMIAMNDADVEQRLRQSGLTMVKNKRVLDNPLDRLLTRGKVAPRVLIEFYFRLSQTLALGLPILSALDENAKQLPSRLLRRVAGEARVALEGGNTLYESLRRFPRVFNRLDLGLIQMGETSGVLPKCLKDLAEFLEWKDNIRSTIRRATIYPSFILLTIVAVVGVWVGYVLPQMADVLKEMGVTLPETTRIVLNVSLFLKSRWPWVAAGAVLGPAALYLLQKTRRGGVIFHKYLLRLPLVGTVVTNLALARLSHNFATMYRAGITINHIFEILGDNVLGNRYLEDCLQTAYSEVQQGQSIATGFERAGGFPPLLLGAVQNGETTGTLDDSFKRLGDYYDTQVKRTVEAMINAFEPITILILGGVFGLIALSILLPLYDVVGNFGQAY